jgi:hypothetical protein
VIYRKGRKERKKKELRSECGAGLNPPRLCC